MHQASEQETAERDSRDVYFQLCRNSVLRMSDLTSTQNAYPSSTADPFPSRKLQLNTLQCQHLVTALQISLEEVKKRMNLDTKPSEVALNRALPHSDCFRKATGTLLREKLGQGIHVAGELQRSLLVEDIESFPTEATVKLLTSCPHCLPSPQMSTILCLQESSENQRLC